MLAAQKNQRFKIGEPQVILKPGQLTCYKLILRWIQWVHLQWWFAGTDETDPCMHLNCLGTLMEIAQLAGGVPLAHYYDGELKKKLQKDMDAHKTNIDAKYSLAHRALYAKDQDTLDKAQQKMNEENLVKPGKGGASNYQGNNNNSQHYCVNAAVYGACTVKGCSKMRRCPFCGGFPKMKNGRPCVLNHLYSHGAMKTKGKGKGKNYYQGGKNWNQQNWGQQNWNRPAYRPYYPSNRGSKGNPKGGKKGKQGGQGGYNNRGRAPRQDRSRSRSH